MASLTNVTEAGILDLVFLNVDYANVGNAGGLRGSTAAGSFQISGHTASPGEAGSQNTSELSYAGSTPYARQAVPRSGSGWTRTGNDISNVALIQFPKRTDNGAVQRFMFWGIGSDSTGAGNLFWHGPIGSALLTFTAATSGNVFTVPNHTGLTDGAIAVDDEVVQYGYSGGATLPGGFTEGTVYFVKTVSGNDITLAATQGGSAITVSSVGAGIICRLKPVSVGQNNQPQFSAGTLHLFAN